MVSDNKLNGTVKFKMFSVILLVLYYFGIGIVDGPKWCVDTESYVSMDFTREPVYPLFLNCLRRLFEILHITAEPYGLPAYLTLAVLLQSLLWVIAACYLGFYILDVSGVLGAKKARILSTVAMLGQVGVAGLNRFVANRGSMYSESIMTESLAMPLYVIFTVQLIKSFDLYDRKAVLKLIFTSVLICSIRKQMLIVLVTWGFASFIIHIFIKKYRSLKKFGITCLAVIIAFLAIELVDCGYNYAARGVFTTHTGNSKGGLCTLLYTARAEDEQLFADVDPDEYPDIEALYSKIYSECQQLQLLIDYAPGYELHDESNIFNSDWVSMASHYADSYDIIGFDVIIPDCDSYVAEHYPELDRIHAQMKSDEVQKVLFDKLFGRALSDITTGTDRGVVYVLTANIVKAFVISNANIPPRFLITVSAIIYAVYLMMFIMLCINKKAQLRDLAMRMMFIVLAGIAINCVVTGSMIFPQPRYMCYGMGMFYFCLFMPVIKSWRFRIFEL